MATKFTPKDVAHIAGLANIPVTDDEKRDLAEGFTKTIAVVEGVNRVDVTGVEPVHTTGLTNVMREDVVDEARQFPQDVALQNAPNTHEGFFVVDQVIDNDSDKKRI